jgi:CBS domain containing-hemolysin-like protein
VRTSETTWDLAGALPLHQLEELTRQPLRQETVNTVSGWVTHRLGGFPKAGDTLAAGAYELRVEAMDGMRVARLKLTKRDAGT